jgi:trk system potassium uptake protein TrkH
VGNKFSPPHVIVASFLLVIGIGAVLLTLPLASGNGNSLGFLDALFTATSATCVTGLVVRTTFDTWSWFGKLIILVLIQIGALGYLTILNLVILLFKKKLSLKNELIIRSSFNQESIGGMEKLVKNVVLFSFIFEISGAIFLFFAFYFNARMPPFEALYQGVFHSISAFCNAGFDNLGPVGLMPYQTAVMINSVIMLLIIAGGLGFPVLIEIASMLKKTPQTRSAFRAFSVHTKIALVVTIILIVAGALFFAFFEWNNPRTIANLSAPDKIVASLFQSVTLRTAGFNTVDQGGLTDISKLFSCLLMIIGGSPAGTAGGIKTVTLGVLFFSMLSVLRGKRYIEAFGRTLPVDLLQKALTVTCALFLVVLFSTIILCSSENNEDVYHPFLDIFVEVCSAAGTVGVSAGITPTLTNIGKIVMMVCMFIGRLGPVAIVVALNMKLEANFANQKYLDGQVIIG